LALLLPSPLRSSFSFHTPPPTLISPLSLHDALPICLAPGRDEALAAVELVAVAVAHGQGGLVGRVRARLRLGEREAAVGVARGDRHQESLALGVGPEARDRIAVERVVDRHDHRVAPPDTRPLL